MATSSTPSPTPARRQRGSIREHRGAFQVRVTAGVDSSSGDRIVLCETHPDRTAAEKARTRLLADADAWRTARTKASFGHLLDRWLPQHDVDASTRATYESLIRNHIRPALGGVPLLKLQRSAAEILEGFYSELRRCSRRCDRRPYVEHRVERDHDCVARGCRPHECRPLAASSVRQIHAIISGALSAAVRWGWLPFNPAESARIPAKPKPQPQPPSARDAARIVEEAWRRDYEWGLYVWLAMVTGARRGELVALRWRHIDMDESMISLRRNFVAGLEKDTKSHQMRRLALDAATIDLLRQHHEACAEVLRLLGLELRGHHFVFSAASDRSRPRDPSSMTRRYKRLVEKLDIDSHLHELRHYSATELLTAGVDLRTVAGRLGHGDGTTTLRHYAAWVAAADQRAAGVVSARLPRPTRPL